MKNFEFYNPVRVIFGKSTIATIDKLVPEGVKLMLCYGGGSIMKNGVYDQVLNALGDRDYIEYGGIMPNPEMEYLIPAVALIKEHNIQYVLAIGGGSVVDAVKFMVAASKFEKGDPWKILSEAAKVESAIPFGVVLTLPATGTEMNGNSVITKAETKEKFAFSSPHVLPEFSVLDPEVTYSLPMNQVVNGVVDAYIHVMEQYLTYPESALVQDAYAESLLRILKIEGAKAYCSAEPDYDNRANIMWAATNALNTTLSMGVTSDWSTHTIGHELTALHGLDHAVTLAIILPGVMEAMRVMRKDRILQYAENIWGLTGLNEDSIIDEAIRRTEEFFKSLGIQTRLSDFDIGQDTIELIINRFTNRGLQFLGRSEDIHLDHLRNILESRL